MPADTPGPVLDVARTGTRREALVALRDRLAAAIDGTDSGRDLPALSRRFVSVLDEIARLDGERPEPSTPLAELLTRRDRAAREAAADVQHRRQTRRRPLTKFP